MGSGPRLVGWHLVLISEVTRQSIEPSQAPYHLAQWERGTWAPPGLPWALGKFKQGIGGGGIKPAGRLLVHTAPWGMQSHASCLPSVNPSSLPLRSLSSESSFGRLDFLLGQAQDLTETALSPCWPGGLTFPEASMIKLAARHLPSLCRASTPSLLLLMSHSTLFFPFFFLALPFHPHS